MIRFIISLAIAIFSVVTSVFAQDITGNWYGKLEIPQQKIRINFSISKDNNTYKATMDSPDQNAFEIPTDTTIYKNKKLEIHLNAMRIVFNGTVTDSIIIGTFSQSGMKIPLNLTRKKILAEKQKARLQDPKKPYPYTSQDIFFSNNKANNIKLAATLTLPKDVKNPKVVVLISGSGPQNRNEEIKAFNHRPFLVLSDFLTKNDIAVLRYDDRGVAKSEGTQKGATTADFATDTEAAVAYLKSRKDINFSKIGLVGHSEGGLIASIVASDTKKVDFIVLLAGTGVVGSEVLQSQSTRANELAGASPEVITFNKNLASGVFKIMKNAKNVAEVKTNLTTYFNNFYKNMDAKFKPYINENTIQQMIKSYSNKWMLYFVKTNPQDYLKKVTCPILALNGSKDFQVLADLNLNGIKTATKHNKNVKIIKLDGLNHLFQTCKTGALSEYAQIEETFSPKAMQIIVDWITKL